MPGRKVNPKSFSPDPLLSFVSVQVIAVIVAPSPYPRQNQMNCLHCCLLTITKPKKPTDIFTRRQQPETQWGLWMMGRHHTTLYVASVVAGNYPKFELFIWISISMTPSCTLLRVLKYSTRGLHSRERLMMASAFL